MSPPKSAESRKSDHKSGHSDQHGRNDALRKERLAFETAQKAAGLWGDLSVGIIERNGAVFVHVWKGAVQTNMFRLSAKRPKEITKLDHEALAAWLKAGSYEGFKQRISAWNVSLDEANRIKLEVISKLAAEGSRVVNPAE